MTPVPKTMSRASALLTLAAALALLGWAEQAAARPGGGQSYSSGSSSSSSSGSSSRSSSGSSSSSGGRITGPAATAMLLFMGLGTVGLITAAVVLSRGSDRAYTFDSSRGLLPSGHNSTLTDLRKRDPDFSLVLFEDFVYALYARLHAARSDPQAMAALTPYAGGEARAVLLARDLPGVKIDGVVIGRLQVLGITLDARVRIDVAIEANYTAELPTGPKGYYVSERWTLERAPGVTSKPPADVYNFQCPSCGGPYERGDQGRCSRCAQQVEGGRFDWWLASVRLFNEREQLPTLTGEVAEQGTNNPSVLEPDIVRRYADLEKADPAAGPAAIERRIRDIHTALNAAYTAGDLRPIRPHVSDSLYNFLSYWTEAYRAQGLRNVLEDTKMSRMEVVKLTRDHHYDALTARIWARGIDYTVGLADGRLVCGDRRQPRAYSEYWTLIRSAKVRGAPRAAGVCPNCGAPLARVNMAGNCEACGTHLTRGEFDWVLSKIEQDDSYAG